MARASLGRSSYMWDSLKVNHTASPFASSEGGPVKPAVWMASDRLPAIWVVHLAGISGSSPSVKTRMAACLQGLLNLGAWSKSALEEVPHGTVRAKLELFP